ncbi:hypothetical protein [Sandaracinus amylolyticus]|uniref:hypothetical protein n=1 Tax=Sandaracinus amylolyticus TaxID=927083 RepID=UPI001F2FD715|nr:hypothetical protein [Sandaracinus amylolyticus]UJR86051.1 Hypothetical protein I5071_81320 [Sandaracinus amylolyticus]
MCFVGLAIGCASTAQPVGSGLSEGRALSALSGDEVRVLCEWQLATVHEARGPEALTRMSCLSGALRTAVDEASCEASLEACLTRTRETLDEANVCDGAHEVPDCDPAHRVGDYEACARDAVEALLTIELDCSMVGDTAQIDAELAALAPAPGCEWIGERTCAPFAPPPEE